MSKRRFLWAYIWVLLPLLGKTVAMAQQVSSGKIVRFAPFKSKYVDARNIDVWLPDGYSAKKKYAVLYMHDGQMLFDSTTTWNKQEWGVDETAGALIRDKKIRETIVVGIWNNGPKRHSEYFPQKPFESMPKSRQDSLYTANRTNGNTLFTEKVQSDQYLRFLVYELKPFIDRKFSTHKGRSHTFVAGSSMGGLISLYAVSEYPQVFGGAACISTHWPGAFAPEMNPIPATFFAYMQRKLPSPNTHKLYFDYGTATLDALYEPYQKQADAILKAKGYRAENWQTLKFEGEDHSERAWRKRLHLPLLFLLGTITAGK